MRNGQKRMRGRGGHRKSQNPMTRVYELNGPDVKIRGTASHIAEKYIQLARDSQSSGDPVAAENYYQHAEHYFRLIAAAQEQFRQQNPYYNQQQQPQSGSQQNGDDNFDGDDDEAQPFMGQNEPSFVPRESQPQPYLPPNAQPFPPRDQQRAQQQPPQQQPQPGGQDLGGLPAFITGGGNQPQPAAGGNQPQPAAGGNGHDQGERNQDRYGGGYRRRRRHRSGSGFRSDRPDIAGNQQGASEDGGEEPQPPSE